MKLAKAALSHRETQQDTPFLKVYSSVSWNRIDMAPIP